MTLREAAQQALEAWDGGDIEWFKRAYSVIDALRAALAEPVQEPVAWRCANATPPGGYVIFQQYPQALEDLGHPIEPLYTAPPQRKPLTDDQITAINASPKIGTTTELVRAIERAHGIGGDA